MMLDDPPTADRAEDLLALLDALPAWRLFCDARDRIVDFWHPEGREAPLPLSDWSERFLAEAIPPPAGALLLDAVQRCRAGGVHVTIELDLGPPDGRRTYEARVVPLTGGRVGILGLDVSSHASVLKALRSSEERFRLAFKTSPDSIAINRASDGKYVAVNQGFVQLLGWTEDEVLGRTSLELGIWANPEQRAALLAELAGSGRTTLEGTFRRRSGDLGTGLMSAVLFEVEGEHHILSVTRDVTAERESERARQELEQELRRSQKLESVGVLASGVAHEFRNLLQVIQAYVDLLRKHAPPESSAGPSLRELDLAVERGVDITSRLLAFSRRAEVRVQRIDVNDVVREVVRLLEHTLPKAIRLELHLSPEALPVDGDSGQLAQVLLNLAVNARDAMPQGGVLEFRSERVAARQGDPITGDEEPGRGELAVLHVHDCGQGMDEATIQRIFDPFFTTKTPAHGTGLGLSVAYGIVTAHGGHIRCRSVPGEGPTFTVLLAAAPGPAPAPRRAPRPAVARGGHEAVLVVDDEPAILSALELLLSENGYRTCTAASGEEALAACRERGNDFDAVLMDLGLPGLGGAALLREIRRAKPRAKVVVSSGSAWDGWREAGATAFLTKPYPLAELLDTLREALDSPE
jgi:PAS domain S-box-containing protein